MREAQTDDKDEDDNAAGQVLDGLGCRDLDGHGNSPAPSLDENEQGDDEDEELGKPLEEDPDALLFNNAFEGMWIFICAFLRFQHCFVVLFRQRRARRRQRRWHRRRRR
jgi:hypothetical protein